ncbi:SusC/RagA family TonB-linked outer membrane protein [Sphingobacterium sp. DK4209]|uniref:SusC/RagA family TonB-linked outer membrane protein n=2 Tax=Sphingobacterium zhuxiongii TaxID=2662364 RepID=A0A5Q0QJL2_9SPHI|nr:SusC/RagA family TonB-linked outer membrane protein [Sphingobacterium sp. DK4209]QGA28302.1 SusC/RagA family TonB-linked outer membrane protein [Sphingobacterium sp. dk4302]
MNLTGLLLAASFMVSYGATHAQVTMKGKNVKVAQALKTITEQTGYRFIYQEGLLANAKSDVDFKNVTLKTSLDRLLKDNNFDFTIHENTVVIRNGQSNTTAAVVESQQLTMKGKVVDSRSGTPIAGATVTEKGTSNAAQTDAQGNFSLTVSNSSALFTVRMLGYDLAEVKYSSTAAEIRLEFSESDLEEVVVVGYGQQRRGDLTGSITSLKGDELTKGGAISNVGQALQGKAAGVVVTQNSKAPGGSISIRIRGVNSISSTNEPLYVIDGFPSNNGVNINPDDIASMEILKDASATAIYGSRGANGVVLITTKRGKTGENNIAYTGYVGTQKPYNPFKMLNGQEYMLMANALYKEIDGQENQEYGVYTKSQLESDVNTDWITATTRRGILQSHNLQFNGGGEKTKVLSSIGYFDQAGILKNTDFSRISGRVNVDQTVNEYIKAGATIFAQRENSNIQLYDGNILNSNVLYGILTYDPTVPEYNSDGTFGRPPGGKGDNPLANLMSRTNDVQRDKLNGNLFLEVKPIKDITIRMDAGTEITRDELGSYLSRESYQGSIDDGVARVADYSLTHNLFDLFVTYSKTFNEKHNFSAMGGYAYEKFTNNRKGIDVYGFSTDLFKYYNLGAASTITGVNSYRSENMMASFFGRVNYSFDDKYLITATVRRDGSSRFGSENQWGTFPSAAFAWKAINESFMKDQTLFTDFKVRFGYGRTGNERIADYASYGLVSNSHYTFDGKTNNTGTTLNPNSPENTKLRWETTSQFNGGLDMAFLNDRLALTVDAYYKKTSDLLIKVTLPFYTGYNSGQSNVGSVENKGLEFALNSKNFVGEFTWDTKLNISINRNKVLSLGGQNEILLTSSKPIGTVSEESYAIIREGQPLGSLFGYTYLGVIQEGEKYSPQPNSKPGDPKFKDMNNDGTISSADRAIIGSAYPKMTFGLTNNFSFKNFDLTAFIYGNVGSDLLNMTRMNMEWKRTEEALNRWTPQNKDTDLPRNGFFYSKYGGYINDHFIENASFLRLRNLTIGYTVPFKTKAIRSLRIYAMGENLFTITKYSGWDPEVDTKAYENDGLVKYSGNAQTANAGAGLDFNSYPSMRSFTFGVSANF